MLYGHDWKNDGMMPMAHVQLVSGTESVCSYMNKEALRN